MAYLENFQLKFHTFRTHHRTHNFETVRESIGRKDRTSGKKICQKTFGRIATTLSFRMKVI